jgi:hypothetical protein
MTIQEFIAKHEIAMSYNRLEARPDRESTDWDKGAFHFRCLMKKGKASYEVTYSMGSGHGKKVRGVAGTADQIIPPKPSLADVMDSLRMDAQSVDDAGDFPEWAGNYEYRTDFDNPDWYPGDFDDDRLPWFKADSIWGCVGYNDVTDWRENPYALDIMDETIRQFAEAWKAYVRAKIDRRAGVCPACHGTGHAS